MTRDREREMLDVVGGPADGRRVAAGHDRTLVLDGARYTWALDDDSTLYWAYAGAARQLVAA